MWHLQTTQNLEFHLYVGAPSSKHQFQLDNGQLINCMYHAAVIMTLSSTAGYKCFLLLLLCFLSCFMKNVKCNAFLIASWLLVLQWHSQNFNKKLFVLLTSKIPALLIAEDHSKLRSILGNQNGQQLLKTGLKLYDLNSNRIK